MFEQPVVSLMNERALRASIDVVGDVWRVRPPLPPDLWRADSLLGRTNPRRGRSLSLVWRLATTALASQGRGVRWVSVREQVLTAAPQWTSAPASCPVCAGYANAISLE